jgi:DnaJ-class molecular chaperone
MDHYNTLGVPRDADQDTIKKAYRKLAMTHHPDKGGDPTQFQKISEAYEVLGDANKRSAYDNPQSRQQTFGGFPPDFNINGFDLNDLFGQIFGQRGQNPNMNNQMYRTRVTVSLVDAYTGNNHILQLSLPGGVKVFNIKVPPGVQSGDQVRYDNIVDTVTLIVEFVVLPDLRFERQGSDLYCNLSISVLDLIVGTKVEFTSIAGNKVEVTINPNTQPAQQIRLRGLGMPINSSSQVYGDQILLLKPYIPDNISNDIIDSINRFKLNN